MGTSVSPCRQLPRTQARRALAKDERSLLLHLVCQLPRGHQNQRARVRQRAAGAAVTQGLAVRPPCCSTPAVSAISAVVPETTAVLVSIKFPHFDMLRRASMCFVALRRTA